MSTDTKTTLAGGGAGVLILGTVDWAALAAGNVAQIAKATTGLLLIALGYWTNKPTVPR